jgi:hypothetical protein
MKGPGQPLYLFCEIKMKTAENYQSQKRSRNFGTANVPSAADIAIYERL